MLFQGNAHLEREVRVSPARRLDTHLRSHGVFSPDYRGRVDVGRAKSKRTDMLCPQYCVSVLYMYA